jgi:hypothetical protein
VCVQIHFAADFPTHTPLEKVLQLIKGKRQSGPLSRFRLCGEQKFLAPASMGRDISVGQLLPYYTDCVMKEERND